MGSESEEPSVSWRHPPEAYAAAPPSEVEFGVEATADAEAAEKAGAVCPQCGSPLFTFQFVLHRI